MKIYQIVKVVGCGEDYHEYVQATYLSKEKAENELSKLMAGVPDCSFCQYDDDYQDKSIKTDCPHHSPKICNVPYEEDECAYTCENYLDPYDAPSYKMKEYDVADDASSDSGIVLEENEIEIADSPDLYKTIKTMVDISHNIKFYLKVRADGKIYIAKVTTSKYGFNDYGFCIQ